jgi:hypothetical protein
MSNRWIPALLLLLELSMFACRVPKRDHLQHEGHGRSAPSASTTPTATCLDAMHA